MGQYYNIALGDKEGKNIISYDRSVNEEYIMAKLMEHSYWNNPCCKCVSELLYKNPQRIAWIGDYAKQDDFDKEFRTLRKIPTNVEFPDVDEVWNDNKTNSFYNTGIVITDKYLVNHEQKVYVDLREYHKISQPENGWVIHPIPLLTVVGNGRGGGDYYGSDEDKVGSWAWNIISIEDEAPKGFEKIKVSFIEE